MGDWGQGSWGLPTFYRPLGIGSQSPPTGKAWPVHPGSSWKFKPGAGGPRTADRCKGSRPSFAGGPSFSLSKIWGGGSHRQMRGGGGWRWSEGLLLSSSPLASHPWLLPPSLLVSPEPATLLAGAPGDRPQMEGSGCVFCFGGWGESLNQEPIWLMKS